MSQEHVAYRVADAFNRRDLDAVLALTDDDVEIVTRAAAMEGGYHGHEGVRRFWEDWLSVFPDSNVEVVEVRDAGDLTVGATRVLGHGARSGTPSIEETVWQAVRWRQGKLVWWGTFGTRADALEAVGLTEQTMRQENHIREGYKTWSDGDLDALLALLDPEIELLTSDSFPDFAPVYRGHDGIRVFWDAIRAPWEWFQLDVERIVEGDDCAAVAVHFRVRGKGSGVSTELQQGHAHWFRHGRTVKVSTHRSFELALEAAGLSEKDAHQMP